MRWEEARGRKIALEEHYLVDPAKPYLLPLVKKRSVLEENIAAMLDVGEKRLAEMDQGGVERSILSLCAGGVQSAIAPEEAYELARTCNDALAGIVASNPTRYGGFAAIPMQDVGLAVGELDRAIEVLGFEGVLLNGYTLVGGEGDGDYYDDEKYLPFWQRIEELRVPLYLHPRFPLPDQRRAYEGFPYLYGSPWGFAVETATHAIRLILSGLFDRFPNVTVLLGHLGELLPFALPRMAQRLRYIDVPIKRSVTEYFRENFYITTSGNYHTPSLIAAMMEIGVDRILYATDYPYESMSESASWFDNLPISPTDLTKIARSNAERLFGHRSMQVEQGLGAVSR